MNEGHVLEVIFCVLHWRLLFYSKWHPRTFGNNAPTEITVGTHFSVQHSFSVTPIFFWADGKVCCLPLSNMLSYTLRWYIVTRKHLFLYFEGIRSDMKVSGIRSGQKKLKKGDYPHYFQLPPPLIYLNSLNWSST